VIWTFYDQVVKVEKGWVEPEFVLLIIATLPSEAELPVSIIYIFNFFHRRHDIQHNDAEHTDI
jgi:hypothetical protein